MTTCSRRWTLRLNAIVDTACELVNKYAPAALRRPIAREALIQGFGLDGRSNRTAGNEETTHAGALRRSGAASLLSVRGGCAAPARSRGRDALAVEIGKTRIAAVLRGGDNRFGERGERHERPRRRQATAALESCAALYSAAFAMARVVDAGPAAPSLSPSRLALMARDSIRRGESVHAISVSDKGLELIPAGGWDVRGELARIDSWYYRVDLVRAEREHDAAAARDERCAYSL